MDTVLCILTRRLSAMDIALQGNRPGVARAGFYMTLSDCSSISTFQLKEILKYPDFKNIYMAQISEGGGIHVII